MQPKQETTGAPCQFGWHSGGGAGKGADGGREGGGRERGRKDERVQAQQNAGDMQIERTNLQLTWSARGLAVLNREIRAEPRVVVDNKNGQESML